MAGFNEIDEARKLLGLRDAATRREIKNAYKRLAHRYHPDKHDGGADETEVMKKLNWAYKLLMTYCDDYKYSFGEEDVARTYPREAYLRRYHDGWFDGI